MANKNFIVKNGLEVGGQEVVSSSGVVTSAALGGQTLASTDSPTFNNLTLTNDIAVGGDLNLTGDLNITGDVNSLSVTDLDVTDQTITLGAGQVESASGGSGIIVAGSNAQLLWDETNSEWDFNKAVNISTSAGKGITIDATQNTSIRLDSDNNTTGPFMIRVNSDEFHIKNQAQSGFNTGGSFLKYTDGGSLQFLGDGLVVTSSDEVAIGHTDPDNRLHIKGAGLTGGIFVEDTGNSSPAPVIKVQGNRQDTNESKSFSGGLALSALQTNALANDGKHIGTIYFGTNHTDGTAANIAYSASISAELSGDANSATDMPTDLVFYTGSTGTALGTANINYGTERLRIDSSGNVGIGTDSPKGLFSVYTSAGAAAFTSEGISTAAAAGEDVSSIDFINRRSNANTIKANIKHITDGTANGSALTFGTTTGSGATEKMRITSTGNLQFTSQTTNFESPGFTYHTNNHLYLRGGSSGLILSDDGGQNTIQISDTANYIRFETTDGSERMRIDSSGDVRLAANATGAALIKGVSGDQTDRDAGGYPQYTFVGNEGTGIRRAGANILAFDAGGSENMRIHETGGLSIDTTNVPANTTGALVLANGGAGGPSTTQPGGGLWIEDSTGTPKLTLYRASGDALRLDGGGANDLMFDNSGSFGFGFEKAGVHLLAIDSSNSSGMVSTNLPLHVSSSSALVAQFTRTGSATYDFTVTDGGDGAAQLYINAQTNDTGYNIRPKNASGTNIDALFIDPDGNIGLGTTSPSEKLHIVGGGSGPEIRLANSSSSHYIRAYNDNWNFLANATNTAITIKNSGAVENPVQLTVGGTQYDTEGNLVCYGDGQNSLIIQTPENTNDRGIAWRNSGGAYIGKIYITDAGSNIGDMVFGVSNATQTDVTNVPERMRIYSTGKVGINNGRTDAQLNARGPDNSGYGIQAEQHGASGTPYSAYLYNANTKVFDFRWYGTTIGHISNANGTSISYNTTSDYRLKENIDYEFTALDRVAQLKPARFNFITDETNTLVDGFIAHEVQEIVPEAVTGEKDGDEMQGIDQSKLVPLLTKAIQEQQTIIEDLKSRLDEAGL